MGHLFQLYIRPSENVSDYYNRKGYYCVVDYCGLFLDA